jgi:adenosylcobinamide-phosphate synthase
MAGLSLIHPYAMWVGGAFLLSFTISPRSLAAAGQEIRRYLLQNNLEQARFKVGWIVGRDTQELDVSEVTRATVETIAENIVDGIIAPLFYFLLGGVPLAYLYRAVNTMDSMVGYKNDKYIAFGMPAAKTDDLFNFIPARITALLIVIAALFLRYDVKNAYHMVMRDARKHPSPNSGYAEAGVAGALGIRLGGINFYGGIKSFRAYMGDDCQPLAPKHIKQTITMMFLVTGLFILFITLLPYSLIP